MRASQSSACVSNYGRCRALNDRAGALTLAVVQNHPWAGIVAPSTTLLPLTPAQVGLIEAKEATLCTSPWALKRHAKHDNIKGEHVTKRKERHLNPRPANLVFPHTRSRPAREGSNLCSSLKGDFNGRYSASDPLTGPIARRSH